MKFIFHDILIKKENSVCGCLFSTVLLCIHRKAHTHIYIIIKKNRTHHLLKAWSPRFNVGQSDNIIDITLHLLMQGLKRNLN